MNDYCYAITRFLLYFSYFRALHAFSQTFVLVCVGLVSLRFVPYVDWLYLFQDWRYLDDGLLQYYLDRWRYNLPSSPPPAKSGRCWQIHVLEATFQSARFQNASLLEGYRVTIGCDSLLVRSYNGFLPRREMVRLYRSYPRKKLYLKVVGEDVFHITRRRTQIALTPSQLPEGWYGVKPGFFSDSALNTAVRAMHIGDYTKELSAARIRSPYSVPSHRLHYLLDAGIPEPNPHSLPHAHPVHYALELLNLYVVSNFLVNSDWYALWLRPSKVTHLTHTSGVRPPVDHFNPRYQGKDITRYEGTLEPSQSEPFSPAPIWFAHDVLHHLSPSAVGRWFDSNPTLRAVVATVVIPPETVFGVQSLRPSLYQFAISGDKLIYIPEDDKGGHYVQPANAHQWLTANKLITPASECLHVALVHQKYAHAVLLISRPQLIPEHTRVMDMARSTVTPAWSYPTATLADRVTTPELVSNLTSYATRVSATSVPDLYAKTAAYQSEIYGKLPQSQVRAAVNYAIAVRAMDFHTHLLSPTVWWLRVSYLVGIPLVTAQWLKQSKFSGLFAQALDVPKVWFTPLHTLVSRPSDSRLPGAGHYCDELDVGLFFLPPSSSWLAQLAAMNCFFVLLLITVYSLLALIHVLEVASHPILALAPTIWRYLGDHRRVWMLFLVSLTMILSKVGFTGRPRRKKMLCPRTFRRAYASLFFLPSAGLRCTPGLGWGFQLNVALVVLALYTPGWCFTQSILSYYWHRVAFMAAPLVIIFPASWFTRQKPELLHHLCVEEYHDIVEEDCSNDVALGEQSPSIPPCEPPAALRPNNRLLTELLVKPVSSPPIELVVLPPPPRDVLAAFRAIPTSFAEFDTFRAVVTNLPPGPITLNPEYSCVWDCISTTLGLDATKLACMWLSHEPVGARIIFDGRVPYGTLNRVIGFFGLGFEIRPAQHGDYADTTPLPFQSLAKGSPFSNWPTMVCYIKQDFDENFHLSLTASPHNQSQPVYPNSAVLVGESSQRTPMSAIREVLNVPVRAWSTSYARLQGTLMNAAAAMIPAFDNVAEYRMANMQLPAVPVQVDTKIYTLTLQDAELARHLSQDMKNNPNSLDLRTGNASDAAYGLDALAKQAVSSIRAGTSSRGSVKIHIISGSAGVGKSHAIKRCLDSITPDGGYTSANLRFHCWLNTLRGPLERTMMGFYPFLRSHNFATGAIPLVQPLGGVLVLDDATQTWPGFIQLLIATIHGLTDIVLTADVTQGRTVFPIADAETRSDPSTSEWIAKLSDHYATEVRRYSPDVGNVLGLPVYTPAAGDPVRTGKIYMVSKAPRGIPFLVVSPRFAETQNNGGLRCTTFRDCQGKTIEGDVAIDLGGLTATVSDGAFWTALTRATGNVFLVMGSNVPSTSRLVESGYATSQILSAIVAVAARSQSAEITSASDPDRLIARAVHAHIASCLNPKARQRLGLPVATPVVGRYVSATDRSLWLDDQHNRERLGDTYTARTSRATRFKDAKGAPAFSQHRRTSGPTASFSVAHALRHYLPVHNEHTFNAHDTGYSLPPASKLTGQFDPQFNHLSSRDADHREITLPGTMLTTSQHIDDGPAAVVHHLARDKATNILSEHKRINVGLDHADLSRVERGKLKQLKRGFGKFFDVPKWSESRFNPSEYERCHNGFLGPWVSKRTNAGIEASLAKDPLDGDYRFTRLFLKGQYVKKEEKRYTTATAGQIVSEFPLGKQFRDAQYATYVERQALRHANATTYLHCHASPDDMSKWYKKRWTVGEVMTANDYTAWDKGCDRTFVHFAAWIMRMCKLPQSYIDLYVDDRIFTRSYLGPHMTKQESGDRWTWLINTLCNAAITGASLCCPPGTPACYSGDDGNVLGRWGPARGFKSGDWAMQPKREYGTEIVFCGYRMGGPDIGLSSTVVMHRAQNGLALGRSDVDYWRSISDAIREVGSRCNSSDADLIAASYYLDEAKRLFTLKI